MQFEIDRCRQLYRSGDLGLAMLPDRSARCVGMRHARLYSQILDRIEAQHYDVFASRARVRASAKAAMVTRLVVARPFRRRDQAAPTPPS